MTLAQPDQWDDLLHDCLHDDFHQRRDAADGAEFGKFLATDWSPSVRHALILQRVSHIDVFVNAVRDALVETIIKQERGGK